ncbi:MAG: hypothetical protein JKY15_06980 [Deltaproteobacteria bacterium]|nr:hypothetical protein [Deltaproteobacteria bacterium]
MKSSKDQTESVGYPNLESLLEQPNPDVAGMKDRQKALEDLRKTAKSAKDKGVAKQSALAYSRFFELFDKLLEVRSKLAENMSEKK